MSGLFPNSEQDYTFGGRTHTNLVVSEGHAPAEKWIVSKDEKVKFHYAFGPEGNQSVVLAKGKLVELAGAEYDSVTSRNISTIKQAGEGAHAFGVNHHNIYEQRRGRFSGNNQPNPTVITRSYIEVPFFEHATLETASDFAKAMHYGAAYGDKAQDLKPGDYVKVGRDGNFVKLDPDAGDTAFQIVGQVGAVERELPPMGFLQYYMDMDQEMIQEFLKARSNAPSPGKNPDGGAGAFPYGYTYKHKGWQADFEELLNPAINKGIPFLTDGYFAAKKNVENISINDKYDPGVDNDYQIEDVRMTGDVTVNETTGDVEVGYETRNAALFIKLRSDIDKGEENPITVKYDDAATMTEVLTVSGRDVHVDYTNNTVVVYLEPGKTLYNLKLDAKLVVDPIAGVPTEWDYAGSVGAIRILQK